MESPRADNIEKLKYILKNHSSEIYVTPNQVARARRLYEKRDKMALGFETSVPNVVFYLKAGSLQKVRKMWENSKEGKVLLEPDYSIELQSGWIGTQYGGCYLKFIKAENKSYNARRTLITFNDEALNDANMQEDDYDMGDDMGEFEARAAGLDPSAVNGQGNVNESNDMEIDSKIHEPKEEPMSSTNSQGVTMHRIARRYKHTPSSLPKLLTFYYTELDISEEYWGNWWTKINVEDSERSLLIFGVPTKYEDKIGKLQTQLYKKLGIMPSNLQPLPSPSVNLSIWLFETEKAEDVEQIDCQTCFIEGPYSGRVQNQVVLHRVPITNKRNRSGDGQGGESSEPHPKRRRVRKATIANRRLAMEVQEPDGGDYVPPTEKPAYKPAPARPTVHRQTQVKAVERQLDRSRGTTTSRPAYTPQHLTITVVFNEERAVFRQFPDCLAANILDQLARYKFIKGIEDYGRCFLTDKAGSIIMDTTPIDTLAFQGEPVLFLKLIDA